jgi:hypothetical protein
MLWLPRFVHTVRVGIYPFMVNVQNTLFQAKLQARILFFEIIATIRR